jgi:hypothetical protein
MISHPAVSVTLALISFDGLADTLALPGLGAGIDSSWSDGGLLPINYLQADSKVDSTKFGRVQLIRG